MECESRVAVLIRIAAVVAIICPVTFGSVAGQISQDQALALAFSGADVERRTAYLDDDQLEEAKLGGALGRSSKGARYTSVEGGD